MEIIIQNPQIQARESLLEFVKEKVSKLEGFSEDLLEVRVTLKIEKSDNRENKVCEIRGVVPGNDLFAEKEAASFEEATMKAVEAMKKQIVTWKEKRTE